MNWYLFVRLLHILSAIVFIGGLLARQILRRIASRTDDVFIFAILSQAAGRVENSMVIPGNLAVILVGVILALMSGTPIFGFLQGASRNWLLVSNLILLFGLLVVPLVFVPRGKKFDLVLKEALSVGKITPQLRAEIDDRFIRFLHITEIVVVVIVVVLMVFKPF
jgi:uncharacterized membrane protein